MAISSQYKPIGAPAFATGRKPRSSLPSPPSPRFPMKELAVLVAAILFIMLISWQATPSLTRSQLAPVPVHVAPAAPAKAPVEAPVKAPLSHPDPAPAHPKVPFTTHLAAEDPCLSGPHACTGRVETPAGVEHTVVRACVAGYRPTACSCFGMSGPLSYKSVVVRSAPVQQTCACTFVADAPQGLARWAMHLACTPL